MTSYTNCLASELINNGYSFAFLEKTIEILIDGDDDFLTRFNQFTDRLTNNTLNYQFNYELRFKPRDFKLYKKIDGNAAKLNHPRYSIKFDVKAKDYFSAISIARNKISDIENLNSLFANSFLKDKRFKRLTLTTH